MTRPGITLFAMMRQILEMIRFSHTVFALPFALSAAVMAWLVPAATGAVIGFRWRDLLGIVVCMVSARSAAMAFNRLVDRKIDAENPRTRDRHLPSGTLRSGSVAVFFVFACLLFTAGTLLFLPNRLPALLSLPVLVFLLAYSYTKRFTPFAHFWLGAALMLAPVAAWIALRGAIVMVDPLDLVPAVTLGAAVLFWVAGFDIIYACQDADFDSRAKLHSIPVRLGIGKALRCAACCHVVMVLLLGLLPWSGQLGGPPLALGWIYWSGILGVALLLAYEHAMVTTDDLTRVNIAFFHVNAIVSVGLFVLVTVDLLV